MDTLFFLFLTSLFLFLYTITQHFLQKLLNFPPTPFPILPSVGHLYFFTKSTPFHRALSHISRRHGPVLFLRLGSWPALLVSSPSAAQECLTKNDIVFANRPNLLNGKHFGYNFTSLAWAPYGDHWRNLRRISALELLSSHKLDTLSSIRADEARALIRKLLKDNDPNKAVDMKALFFEHTYNVVIKMITGELGTGSSSEEAEMFREIVAEMAAVTLEANIVDFLPFVGWFGFRDVERKLRLVQEKRERFMKNVIEKHRVKEEIDCNGKQKSLIQVLLDLQREEPEYYSDEAIRNLLLVLVQGASHTSSNTLEWAFSLLLQNTDILTRARADVDNLAGKDRLLNESDVSRLPYLLAIIKETLRMHPAAPLLTPHVSSEECMVGGFRVPRGTILLVNAWDIQNNPKIWKDPEKFMPERFEGGKNDFEFVPFGWGRRACPGEKLAMQMVGLALGRLIQCFEWEKIGEIDMTEGKGIITPRVQPLRAKCIARPFVFNLLS